MPKKLTKEEKEARHKIPRVSPPIYFSHPSLSEGKRRDSARLTIDGKTRMELLAGVSVGALPGAGFIHLFPTVEQIDEIVACLLSLKERMK